MPEIIVKLGDSVVHKHLVYKDKIMIGRSPDNEIAIENLAVSRHHASIRKINGRYVVEDNNSANGTYVNGVRVTKTEILDKDVITIGKHKLHFYDTAEEPVAAASMDLAQQTMVVSPEPLMMAVLKISLGKQKEEIYELTKIETRIGRASDNDIRLNDWFVSKHHAMIIRKGAIYLLRDLASWRHTFVNGQIVQEQPLKAGDEIQFGPKITAVFDLKEADRGLGHGRVPVEMANMSDSMIATPNGKKRVVAAMPVMEGPTWEKSDLDVPETGDSAPASKEEASAAVENAPAEEPEVVDSPEPDFSSEASEEQASAGEPVVPTATWGLEAVLSRAEDDEASESEAPSLFEQSEELFGEGSAEEDIQEPEEAANQDSEVEFFDIHRMDEFEESDLLEDGESNEVLETPGEDENDGVAIEAELEAPAEFAAADQNPEAADEPAESAEPAEPKADDVQQVAAEMSSVVGELSGAQPEEVAMWLRALQNPSNVIRKQAQRKLKQLTGRDYDIQ